jgi:hypothetical protein
VRLDLAEPGGRGVVGVVEAQPLDVAANGARGDAEPFGQVRAAPLVPALEQRQQAQQARGGLQHASSLAAMAAWNWPLWLATSPAWSNPSTAEPQTAEPQREDHAPG